MTLVLVGSGFALLAWLCVLVAPHQPHRVREWLEADPGQPDDLGQHGLVDHDEHKGRSVGSAKFALHSTNSQAASGPRIRF